MALIVPAEYRWQHRAVKETGGNTTLLGCFVLAILGWQHGRHPPRFGSTARITKEGIIITHMQAKDGTMYRDHNLGQVQTVIDNFRGLADHLKLNDQERVEMFTELKKWFVKDERANQSVEERGTKDGGLK